MRQLDAASPRDPVSENRGRLFAARAPSRANALRLAPDAFPSDAAPELSAPFAVARGSSASGSRSRAPRPENASPSRAPSRAPSGAEVARAPALVLSALPQKALNSNGCRCFRPYTKRPAGRCCSRVVTAAWYAASLASVPVECVEDAPGERLRLRSVLAGELGRPERGSRSGVAGAPKEASRGASRGFERSSEETHVWHVALGGDAPRRFARVLEASEASEAILEATRLCSPGAQRGGQAVAALAPERVQVTSSVPSAAWPAATGDDSAVVAAKTRAVRASRSTKLNALPFSLMPHRWRLSASARSLGSSACASQASRNASATSDARTSLETSAKTHRSFATTWGANAGPAPGEGTPSPRNATAPHARSTTRYREGMFCRLEAMSALCFEARREGKE